MPRRSSTRRRKRANETWFEYYFGFYLHWKGRWKDHKILALLWVIGIGLVGVITASRFLGIGWPQMTGLFASNKLQDKSKIEKKNVSAKSFDYLSLFHDPHQFYYSEGERLGKDEMIDNIKLNGDSLYVGVTTNNTGCNFDFVLENFIFQKDTIHKIIPEYPIINDTTYASINDVLGYGDTSEDTSANQPDQKSPCEIEYDDKVGNGSPIDKFFKYDNPSLEISITNKSSHNLLNIEDLQVKVKKSAVNQFPYLYFGTGAGYNIPIFNEGWGNVENVVLKFNIIALGKRISYAPPYKYSVKIPKLHPWNVGVKLWNDEVKVDLEQAFRSEGVNTKVLNKLGDQMNLMDSLYKHKVLGRFKNGEARVEGIVIYDGILPDKSKHTDSVAFTFPEYLMFPSIGGFEGAGFKSNYDVKLNSDEDNYSKYKSVNASIPPGTTAKIPITFYSDKPGYHYFDLIVNYNGDKHLTLKNFFLNNFIEHSNKLAYKATYKNKRFSIKRAQKKTT